LFVIYNLDRRPNGIKKAKYNGENVVELNVRNIRVGLRYFIYRPVTGKDQSIKLSRVESVLHDKQRTLCE
jgi:hypothetical protein